MSAILERSQVASQGVRASLAPFLRKGPRITYPPMVLKGALAWSVCHFFFFWHALLVST